MMKRPYLFVLLMTAVLFLCSSCHDLLADVASSDTSGESAAAVASADSTGTETSSAVLDIAVAGLPASALSATAARSAFPTVGTNLVFRLAVSDTSFGMVKPSIVSSVVRFTLALDEISVGMHTVTLYAFASGETTFTSSTAVLAGSASVAFSSGKKSYAAALVMSTAGLTESASGTYSQSITDSTGLSLVSVKAVLTNTVTGTSYEPATNPVLFSSGSATVSVGSLPGGTYSLSLLYYRSDSVVYSSFDTVTVWPWCTTTGDALTVSAGDLYSTYYVRGTDGSFYGNSTGTFYTLTGTNARAADDSNTGGVADPLATVACALTKLTASGIASGTIYVDGTVTATSAASNNSALDVVTTVTIAGMNSSATDKLLAMTAEQFTAGNTNRRLIYAENGSALTLKSLTLANGRMTDDNAGGGLYVHTGASVTVENCVFMNNRAENGGGVYDAGTFTLSGSTVIAPGSIKCNDVYLVSDHIVKVSDTFSYSGAEYAAALTYGPGNATTGVAVVQKASYNETDTSTYLSVTECSWFALTKTSYDTADISAVFCIAPVNGQGTTAKAGVTSSGMTVNNPVACILALSGPSTITSGSSTSMTINGSEITDPTSATLTLYQNGTSLASISGCSVTSTGSIPTLTPPTLLPSGAYQLYMQAVVNGKAYSAVKSISIVPASAIVVSDESTFQTKLTDTTSSTLYLGSDITITAQSSFSDLTACTLKSDKTIIVPPGQTYTIKRTAGTGPFFAPATSSSAYNLTLGSENGGTLIIDGGAGEDLSNPVVKSGFALIWSNYNQAATIKLYNVIMQNNYNNAQYQGGGALYPNSCSVYMYNCTIQNCYANASGGGIVAISSNIYMYHTVIKNCRSGGAGGGILLSGNTAYLADNSSIINNSASSGGGVWITSGILHLMYSGASISGNTVTGSASQVRIQSNAHMYVYTGASTYTDNTSGDFDTSIAVP